MGGGGAQAHLQDLDPLTLPGDRGLALRHPVTVLNWLDSVLAER